MSERAYSAIPFADVRITGPFWRERLETVLSRPFRASTRNSKRSGILEFAQAAETGSAAHNPEEQP